MKHTPTLKLTMPTARQVVLQRVFDAPRMLVFDALTKPALIKRWYAMSGWSLVVCRVDLKVGGKWRYVMRRRDGHEVGQYGVYREIVPGERLVNTERWEDWDPGETLVTTELRERRGRTAMKVTIVLPSKEVREVILKGGLQDNIKQLYGRLDKVLAKMPGRVARPPRRVAKRRAGSRETKPGIIDAYLARVPAEQRAALEKLRKTIMAAAPRAEECISYGLAAFRLDGRALVAFAAWAKHCAFYPMSGRTVAAHRADLAGYETSKGTIRFQPNKPLPAALVRKIVKARIAQNSGRS
jgi:uncharacterized protein YndB with AHSA1/START domain/uncharacterized protein YdhG (YjbR/CyaY superfamily)